MSELNQHKFSPLVCLLPFSSKQNIYLILEDFGISRLNNEFATVHLPSVVLNDSDRVRVL